MIFHKQQGEACCQGNYEQDRGLLQKTQFIGILETHDYIVSHLLINLLIAAHEIIVAIHTDTGIRSLLIPQLHRLFRMADFPYIGSALYGLKLYRYGKKAGRLIGVQRYPSGKHSLSQFIRNSQGNHPAGQILYRINTDFFQISSVADKNLLDSGVLSHSRRLALNVLIARYFP